MDAEEFLTRAEEGKRKHAEDLAARELQVQAENRRAHLKNALQSFGELWSSSFLDSLPFERAPRGEWSGQEWAQHRPEFDDWRTQKTMAICNDERVLAWRQEILALAPTDIPQRNTAVLILQAAIDGREDTVRAIWGSMLPEAADNKERYPNSDPALLPSLVIMWLKWKLAEELTEGAPTQPASQSTAEDLPKSVATPNSLSTAKPPNDPAHVRVDLKESRVWIGNKSYEVKPDAATLVQALIDADGRTISAGKVVDRVTRVVNGMPAEVRALIEKDRGRGSCIPREKLRPQ